MEAIKELALNDPFYIFIKGHKAFSETMQRRLVAKGIQTLAFADVDQVHTINDRLGYRGGGTKILRVYAEAAKEIGEKYGGLVAHYGGDEYTFLFPRPASEVAAIMRELQRVAMDKMLKDETGTYNALAEEIRNKEIFGTASVGVMQINFPLHERKFVEKWASNPKKESVYSVAERRAIYASVMDWCSRPLSSKDQEAVQRGSILVIKDEAKMPERKR